MAEFKKVFKTYRASPEKIAEYSAYLIQEFGEVETELAKYATRSNASKASCIDKLSRAFKIEFYDAEKEMHKMAELDSFVKFIEEAGKNAELSDALSNLNLYSWGVTYIL